MWRKSLVVLSLCLTLSSCAGVPPLAKSLLVGAAEKRGIAVDANVGQARTEGEGSVAQQANTAVSVGIEEDTYETFEGPVGMVINEAGLEMHELLLLILLAGWAIPSPGEMLHSIARSLRGSYDQLRRPRSD
jgi:hypothetical protein